MDLIRINGMFSYEREAEYTKNSAAPCSLYDLSLAMHKTILRYAIYATFIKNKKSGSIIFPYRM